MINKGWLIYQSPIYHHSWLVHDGDQNDSSVEVTIGGWLVDRSVGSWCKLVVHAPHEPTAAEVPSEPHDASDCTALYFLRGVILHASQDLVASWLTGKVVSGKLKKNFPVKPRAYGFCAIRFLLLVTGFIVIPTPWRTHSQAINHVLVISWFLIQYHGGDPFRIYCITPCYLLMRSRVYGMDKAWDLPAGWGPWGCSLVQRRWERGWSWSNVVAPWMAYEGNIEHPMNHH